ncbi:ribonuclease H-like domain-containing protein [Tanacetum coccineum]
MSTDQQPVLYPTQFQQASNSSRGILGAALGLYLTQATSLPSAFSIMAFHDSTRNMDTRASSYLNSNVSNLSIVFNRRLFPSVHVGDDNSILVTNTDHSIIPCIQRPLHLHNVLVTPNIIKNLISVCQFTRDNNYTIEFDAFGFFVKDFLTRHILLQCDSSGDLYPVTKPSTTPVAFLSTSASTSHQRLGHLGDEVRRSLVSRQFISCNKEKSPHICHAFQLGKHVKHPFHSSDSIVERCFDIIHSYLWTSPIWLIHQLDVKNAFLNGDLSKIVYMHQPPSFVDARQGSHVAYLLLYVDDIILTAYSTALLQHLIDSLHCEFDMTYFGALNYYLGISNVRHSTVDTESKLGPERVSVQDPTLYQSLTEGLQYLTFTRGLSIYTHVYLSAEAEYWGVANIVAKTAWLRNLLHQLHSRLSTATLVYCDNVSAVYMSANPVQHQQIKHIGISIHFIRDMVTAGQNAPKDITNLRPISLINSPYKILSKVIANRLRSVMSRFVSKNQSAFITDRHLSDSVMMVNELWHLLKKSKTSAMFLKLDFTKAYDSVSYKFMNFPFEYLGVPIGINPRHINAWQKVIDRFKMKLTRWRGSTNNSNQATRSVAKAVLMGGSSRKKNLHLVAWNIVYKPKELGGLGVVPLRLKNIALLASWWAKFNANKSSFWKLVIKKKYSKIFPSKLIEFHSIPSHSQASTVWKNIVNIQRENNILQVPGPQAWK